MWDRSQTTAVKPDTPWKDLLLWLYSASVILGAQGASPCQSQDVGGMSCCPRIAAGHACSHQFHLRADSGVGWGGCSPRGASGHAAPCSCTTVPSEFWRCRRVWGHSGRPWPWAAVCTGMAAWLGQKLGLSAPRVSRRKPGAGAALTCGGGVWETSSRKGGQPSRRPRQRRDTPRTGTSDSRRCICARSGGRSGCLAVGPAAHFLLCPHVLRPSEALSGSVWISPLWLSHVQGLLWDHSGWRAGLTASEMCSKDE